MARASGAYCSLPGSIASAIGIRPRIVAIVVIRIGRRRTLQASVKACFRAIPSCRRVPTNSTIRMLSETTMPVIMTTPISDITFKVVPVSKQKDQYARQARGDCQQDDERIGEGGKLRHQDQVDQDHRQDEPDAKAGEGLFHVADGTAHLDGHPIRLLNLSDDGFDLLIHPTEIFLLRHDIDIELATQLIMVYFRWCIDLLDVGARLERRCIEPFGDRRGICLKSVMVLICVSGYCTVNI